MAVVFDLDGTLIDSLPHVAEAGNAVLLAEGLPGLETDAFRYFVGLGEQVFLDRLIAATGLNPSDRPALMRRFIDGYKVVSQHSQLFPGVQAALLSLKKRGVPIGLCTNKPQEALSVVLKSLGWQDMFGAVVAGDTLALRKPHPEPLHLAFQTLGVDGGLYVGDSETDAETAKRAEMPFALFTKGIRVSPIEDIPHTVVFDDFAKFDEIAAKFA